jgi:hypothetical protein
MMILVVWWPTSLQDSSTASASSTLSMSIMAPSDLPGTPTSVAPTLCPSQKATAKPVVRQRVIRSLAFGR